MKFADPTGNGKIIITQTYHGENSKLPDTQCAIDIRMNANEFFHSATDGIVEGVWPDYVSIIPTDSKFRVLYVHTDRHIVKKGQVVKANQKLGQIAPIENPHLHFGLKWTDMHKPAPRPMDYFDRTLNITTDFVKYPDIAKEWFINKKLNWSLFKDLQYGPVTPPESTELVDLRKQIITLEKENDTLKTDVATLNGVIRKNSETISRLGEENVEYQKSNNQLTDTNDRLQQELKLRKEDCAKHVQELNDLKRSTAGKVVEILGFFWDLFKKKTN